MIEFYIVKNRIKNNLSLIGVYLLFLILKVIILVFGQDSITENEILQLVGVPNFEMSLLTVFKMGTIIYLVYSIAIYEFKNSAEFIFLRLNLLKWLVKKSFALIIVISVLDLLCFLLILVFFYNNIGVCFSNYVLTLLYDLSLTLLVMDFSLIIKKKYIILIISITIGLLMFNNFSYVTILFALVISVVCRTVFLKNKKFH